LEGSPRVLDLSCNHDIESYVAGLVKSGDQLSQLAGAELEIVDHCCARHKCPHINSKPLGIRLLLKTDGTKSSRENKRERFKKTRKLLQDLGFEAPEWYDYTYQEVS
jgi:hypothetical protein